MKKILVCFIIVAILIAAPGSVLGASIIIDGEEAIRGVRIARTDDNEPLFPLRSLADILDYSISWDSASRSVLVGNVDPGLVPHHSLPYFEGSPAARVINSTSAIENDVSAIVVNGQTMAPSYILSRAFAVSMIWDDEHSTLLVSSRGNPGEAVPAPGGSTLYVPDHYATIQEAINRALDGDEIVVRPDVYEENINFKGKRIIIRSINPANSNIVEATVIDAKKETITESVYQENGADISSNSAVVTFAQEECFQTMLQGFTITGNGIHGIHVSNNSSPVLKENRIINNKVNNDSGGGISITDGSSPQITDNIISNNIAKHGGGISVGTDSSPLISNNIITDNRATLSGGGISVYNSSPTILNNSLSSNIATGLGGGISVVDATPSIIDNYFAKNRAGEDGGAVWVDRLGSIVHLSVPDDNNYTENTPNDIVHR